jgi:putative ATP-dependent endonuclease of the OLD family
MHILALRVRNFRTIETLDLTFPSAYAAICGPNDSGKTNVIRAIRALMREDQGPYYSPEEEVVSTKEDFPKWSDIPPQDRTMEFGLKVSLHQERDAGFYQFLTRQLSLENAGETISFDLSVSYRHDTTAPDTTVVVDDKDYTGLQAQEVLKRLQTSRSILFHNSVQQEPRFRYTAGLGQLRDLTGEAAEALEAMKKQVDRGLRKVAKGQQDDFAQLLGRLEKKYKVGLSVPSFDLSWLPYNITLGESKYEVALDNWGSGTQNRTLILLTLFRAKQISESPASANKVTPLIVIEEPESFLHPSAQSEFGRLLQDLAEEFKVQVVITTHSPYLLCLSHPESNILLKRRSHYNTLRETQRIDTAGESWMEPFSQALGLTSEEFRPWRQLLTSQTDSVLLVEGPSDKEYFEMLRDPAHGPKRLDFKGEIIAYEGTGSLHNTVLLRFIKNRYKRLFVTFDLDAKAAVEKTLKSLNLVEGTHYMAVGADQAGKKCIEGLLPDSVRTAVFQANVDLVQAAMAGTPEEQKRAKGELKALFLKDFKAKAEPGDAFYKAFYPIAKAATKALTGDGDA